MCRGIAKKKPSNYLSYRAILMRYLRWKMTERVVARTHRGFVAASKDPGKTQADWLLKFLADRKDTVIGRDWGFDSIKSVEDYRSKIPVTRYDSYKDYMERVAKGEANVVNKGKPSYIVLTSGTTGNNKKFWFDKAVLWNIAEAAYIIPLPFKIVKFPSVVHLREPFVCTILPNMMKSESGCRMGPLSCCVIENTVSTTPIDAILGIKDEKVIMYIHAVFGLLHDDTESIVFNFVSSARSFFVTLETSWKDIVEDIRTGHLNPSLKLSAELRHTLDGKMWSNPKRAAELAQEFERGFEDIIPRIWKEASGVTLLSSGSLQAPSLTLQRRYFPSVPVLSPMHLSSEGCYGVCLDNGSILSTYYTLLPLGCFYEFIPLAEIENDQPQTKLIEELELNEQYELCVTTDRGLCRYRAGDIIKVVSYFNKIPQYELIGRHGVILDICSEKTSEVALTSALQQTMSKLRDFTIVEFTSAESSMLETEVETAGSDRHYILFVELESKLSDEVESLTEEQKDMFDEDLQDFNEYYKGLRCQGRIQKMKVVQMKPGSFALLKILTLAMNTKASSAQFKNPRVLRTEKQLELMTNPENVL
ncbi:uncharacterized protein LOC135495468 [Lineus longissimus]|uniref:uncharacterized protein LOC135495468 n=1 Tax=Lineus longissimus TaxID=88925 RepID=UPI00315CC636